MEYTWQPIEDIILIVKIWYYIETVIQIFKTYTVTRILCYIGIISRILTDSYRRNKKEYGLYVFIESLHNDLRESYSKDTGKFCSVFTHILSTYGRIRCKKKKKSVFTVLLCCVNEKGHHGYFEDVSITFIDKTDPS